MRTGEFEYLPKLRQTSFDVPEQHLSAILLHLKAKGIKAASLAPSDGWADIIATASVQEVSQALIDVEIC